MQGTLFLHPKRFMKDLLFLIFYVQWFNEVYEHQHEIIQTEPMKRYRCAYITR